MPHEKFIAKVLAERDASNPAWLAKMPDANSRVTTTTNRFQANSTERAEIQRMGQSFGCHTCNKSIDKTPQHYIADHIPPREILGNKGGFRYFPHCDRCASVQSGVVLRYQRTAVQKALLKEVGVLANRVRLAKAKEVLTQFELTEGEITLLCGGKYDHSTDGKHGRPHQVAVKSVQTLGKTFGCHSCRTKQPSSIYHADHCPPKELTMTAWFPAVLRKLGVDWSHDSYFRPQCPSCSRKQGVRCRKLVAEALKLAPSLGVIRYPK